MEIKRLFGKAAAFNASNLEASALSGRQIDDADYVRAQQVQTEEGTDVVNISSRSRSLSQISDLLHSDQTKRQSRIDQLREQIAAGTYRPKSEDVARSLISYASELPPLTPEA